MTAPLALEETRRPASSRELFLTYCGISLQAFGGALAITERTLVRDKRWFTPKGSRCLSKLCDPCKQARRSAWKPA